MQYVFSDRRTNITSIEFRNSVAIPRVERMRSFREENLVGNFIKKEFRWSFDNVTWNPWQLFTQSALAAISFQDYSDFYIHIKYYRSSAISGNIGSILLTYDSKDIAFPSPDSSIIDADLLQGEDGTYYLNNENHFGPSLSVKIENVPTYDSSGAGVYYGRIDTSIDTTFQLKRIRGVGGITVIDEVHAVILGLDASATGAIYDSALDPTVTMPAPVGGIPAGTTVADLNSDLMSTLWDSLLFPTVQPILNAPTASIAMSPSTTLYEVSTNITSLQFTATFSQGSIYNGATYQNVRSGSCNNYNYTGTFPVDISKNTSPDVQSYQYYVKYGGSGVQSWSCAVGYNQGPQPLDNKGNNAVAGPLAAGSVNTNTLSMEGSYPYFASSVTGTLTKQTLLAMATNPMPSATTGFSLVTEIGRSKQQFDIPNARLTLASLKGIKTYNTISGQWEYELGTNTLSLTRWTTSQVTQSIQGFSTPYTRYTYNGTDRAAVQVQLQF